MKSNWFTQSNFVAGEGELFIATRIKDISQVVHSGNLEHYGSYDNDRDKVDAIVCRLNSGNLSPEVI